MSDDKTKNNPPEKTEQTQQQKQPEPDHSVEHRKIEFVFDHAIPDGEILVESSKKEK